MKDTICRRSYEKQYTFRKKCQNLQKSLCLNLKMFHSITFNGRKIIKIIILKVALSPSKENYFVCVTEWSLKIIKNAFYFILKALFVLKISKFLS